VKPRAPEAPAEAIPLSVGVAWDESRREQVNRGQRNYWYAYIWEILDRLGVTGVRINPSSLANPRRLARFGCIIVGGLNGDKVSTRAAQALADWVKQGGTLIGFAPDGLDEVFGTRPRAPTPQPRDDFAITGYLELARTPLTQGIHSTLRPEQRLIIISPVRPVAAHAAREVARFLRPHPSAPDDGARARDGGLAAVTARRLGRGWACYFGFDVAHSVWAIQQGRPVDADYDGDGYYRSSDAVVIGRNSPQVAYSHELILLLRGMLSQAPLPMVHELPAHDGECPDALFYFGGDDECAPNVQVPASDFMRSRNLPYHINLMPVQGRFAISRREFRHIRANGHELSLHYNFWDGFAHPGPFAEADVVAQNAAFRKAFGRRPVCTVNHGTRWTGWSEPAKWMQAVGGKADNSRIHWPSPPLNPVNRLGFAFGTPFPYFFRDDWRGKNARIPFLQEPIIAYELGYEGDATDFGMLRRAIGVAVRHHMTMNMFYHPVYIVNYPACRAAIDELLRYLRARKARAVFMGNDDLWRWWRQRSRARIKAPRLCDGCVSFTARCGYGGGFVVKVPLSRAAPVRCTANGKPARFHVERRFGRDWVFLPLPPGEHDVVVETRAALRRRRRDNRPPAR
jgi:hypothetical protein